MHSLVYTLQETYDMNNNACDIEHRIHALNQIYIAKAVYVFI